jgi:hypothetical protein
MNIFFEGLKNRNSTLWMIAYGFHNFKLPFWRKSKLKFLLASMKSLTNGEIHSCKPLPESLFWPPVSLNSGSVTRLWSWKLFQKPALNVHWKKLTNESKGKPGQKFDAAFGTIFRIDKCFQRSKQKLHINFSLELGRLKIWKPFAHVQKVLIKLYRPWKKYLTGDIIP